MRSSPTSTGARLSPVRVVVLAVLSHEASLFFNCHPIHPIDIVAAVVVVPLHRSQGLQQLFAPFSTAGGLSSWDVISLPSLSAALLTSSTFEPYAGPSSLSTSANGFLDEPETLYTHCGRTLRCYGISLLELIVQD